MAKTQSGYQAIAKVVEQLIESGAHKATAYLSDKFIVNATRRLFKYRTPGKTENVQILLIVGKPNYTQRLFIKQCKKAGEPFPIRKIQLKFPAKKKRK